MQRNKKSLEKIKMYDIISHQKLLVKMSKKEEQK